MDKRKLLEKALAGSKNISFKETISLVEAFGFHLSRIKGSHFIFTHPQIPEHRLTNFDRLVLSCHFIFTHPQIPELVNLQEQNGKAKPYQVRQFLQLIERYHLDLED